jgi:hypothetical protein
MFFILHEKVHGVFLECVAFAHDWVFFTNRIGYLSGVFEFPWIHIGGRVILEMLYFPAAFQQKSLQPFFAKFFGCPTAAHAGANYNGVETVAVFSISHNVIVDQDFVTGTQPL